MKDKANSETLEKPKRNIKPTLRRQLLASRLMVNQGNVSKSMIEVGYSPAYAKNPQEITNTTTFQSLLDEFLPERHLSEKHREFLDSKRIIRTYVKGEMKEETEETDPNAVKALDMAYKLRGKYQDKVGNNVLIINVSNQSADRYKQI
jgi:hypothetical protein